MPLKQINQLKQFFHEADRTVQVVEAKIAAPGNPKLAVFCCSFQYIAQRIKRTGAEMDHGKKRWFPCQPTIYEPEQTGPSTYRWEFPRCLCGDGVPCFWNIVEFGAPPILEWSSLPHACLLCPSRQATAIGRGGSPSVIGNPHWVSIDLTSYTGSAFYIGVLGIDLFWGMPTSPPPPAAPTTWEVTITADFTGPALHPYPAYENTISAAIADGSGNVAAILATVTGRVEHGETSQDTATATITAPFSGSPHILGIRTENIGLGDLAIGSAVVTLTATAISGD